MKMSRELFEGLRDAIDRVGGLTSDATMRNRWDQLYASRYPMDELYAAGLNDRHIDTALRRIARDGSD